MRVTMQDIFRAMLIEDEGERYFDDWVERFFGSLRGAWESEIEAVYTRRSNLHIKATLGRSLRRWIS
jgi:hypothetical protein